MSDSSSEQPITDYISPGYAQICLDPHFPNLMRISDPDMLLNKQRLKDRPLRHHQYWDKRVPNCGFVNRDEAHILYNTALRYPNVRGLEIGCFFGWSACHLLAGGITLDLIDPIFKEPGVHESVQASIRSAGFADRARLIAEGSPDAVARIGMQENRKWQLFFIDADPMPPRTLVNAFICARFAAPDCLMIFRNLWHPGVLETLDYLQSEGWNTVIYDTFTIIGAAWRGGMKAIAHTPDPNTGWSMPASLQRHPLAPRVG
ncbi:MAG: class I SAM-dependent methyltransferase [Gammaproteobacteria bacterium]|nr:class I SAM-dependent methyltransferase [Gammaproteobacteria bacterium]